MSEIARIRSIIVQVRGQRVILDADLAALYGVETRRLNEQVKRNSDRFPDEFMFELTRQEWANLRSQFATSSVQVQESQKVSQADDRSHGGRRQPPRAFTEHGAIMAATVLNSPEAVAMSLYVVRTFIQLREQIALGAEIVKRFAEIDAKLLDHDQSLRYIWSKIQPLLAPAPIPPKRQVGFKKDKE